MIRQSLISVLMPTYNDSKYISVAVESALSQNNKKWELIIIDDGSTDNTPKTMASFDDPRITYLRLKENSGQLNALMKGVEHAKGRFVTLLHSDDELADDKALERNISALENSESQGIFCDLLKVDERGETQGILKTVNAITFLSPAILFLAMGSNIISDIFFVRKSAFNNVLTNYITWNIPYWLKVNETSISCLKLRKVDTWYKYRIYGENYQWSDVGKFEIVNGCLRTVLEIGQRINVPFLTLQRLLVRLLGNRIKPFFTAGSCSPKKMQEMVMYILNSRFQKIPRNVYFDGLLGFYSNFPSKRTIQLSFGEERTFLGKDARIFYNLMGQKLPSVYEYILEEATTGFGKVLVLKKDYEKARNILKFFNLLAKIEVK